MFDAAMISNALEVFSSFAPVRSQNMMNDTANNAYRVRTKAQFIFSSWLSSRPLVHVLLSPNAIYVSKTRGTRQTSIDWLIQLKLWLLTTCNMLSTSLKWKNFGRSTHTNENKNKHRPTTKKRKKK